MQQINDILNWTFLPSNLSSNAERIISSHTKIYLKDSIKAINEISNKSITGYSSSDPKLIKDIYTLFIENKYKDRDELVDLFSKRDARLLVSSLDYHPDSGELPIIFTEDIIIALQIISDRWRDLFIVSLWHILLKNWDVFLEHNRERKLFIDFLSKKCGTYEGSRKDILSFISNSSLLLEKKSPSKYAQLLIKNSIHINKANELINQKTNILLFEYFSNVLIEYVGLLDHNNIEDNTLNEIYELLDSQNSFKTKLLVCSAIINNSKFDFYKKDVKENTIRLIGDPIKKDRWVSNKLSEEQEDFVESARMKLNAMLNHQFIKVFFEKLVSDSRRKNYWLKFIDKIEDIKFIGNRSNYFYLKNIKNISKFVDSRYKTTSSNQSTCALVIYSQNYVFVEFTDTGALYIYKRNNFKVNLNAVRSMPDLKAWPTSLMACRKSQYGDYYEFKEEGRMIHSSNWEMRLDAWMKKYYKTIPKANRIKRPIESSKVKNKRKKIFSKSSESNQSIKKSVNKRKSYSDEDLDDVNYSLFDKILKGKNYVPKTSDERWESKTLYWSKKELPGYIYSYKKDAWWKRKDDY